MADSACPGETGNETSNNFLIATCCFFSFGFLVMVTVTVYLIRKRSTWPSICVAVGYAAGFGLRILSFARFFASSEDFSTQVSALFALTCLDADYISGLPRRLAAVAVVLKPRRLGLLSERDHFRSGALAYRPHLLANFNPARHHS